jgi:Tfp pilus assembly protein PilV
MRRNKSQRAFTLIEVMAAAIMLLLVVAALSEMLAAQARREGDARGEARAALLADRVLAEIEEGIARGAAPQLGPAERTDGDLRAALEVRAFDPTAAAAALAGVAENAKASARASEDGAPSGGWLSSPTAEVAPPVLEIVVRVDWSDAPEDPASRPLALRTTYALNPAALKPLEASDAASSSERKRETAAGSPRGAEREPYAADGCAPGAPLTGRLARRCNEGDE